MPIEDIPEQVALLSKAEKGRPVRSRRGPATVREIPPARATVKEIREGAGARDDPEPGDLPVQTSL